MRRIAILLAALISFSAQAQVGVHIPGDPRLQSVDYRPDGVTPIQGIVGYQIVVELAPDEVVRSIALGDSSAWHVNADKAGNRLFLKPTAAGVATNMTVVTDVRTYAFDLTVSADGTSAPYAIRFRYPDLTSSSPDDASFPTRPALGGYKLRGHHALWPTAISDDGVRTFIEWPADGPLPATYIRDTDGHETLANGYMRGRFYVLDSVDAHLVFRLDKRSARANRVMAEQQ